MTAEPILMVDVESASAADISVGSWAYSQHESTIVHCVVFLLCYGPNDRRRYDWVPGQPMPQKAQHHVLMSRPVVAHNALFEWSIWQNILGPRHGFATVLDEQWLDTAARAVSYNLPPALEGVGAALGCGVQKDKVGAKLMRKMAKAVPDGEGGWLYDTDPENLAKLIEYCATDCEAQADVFYKLPPMHPFEALTWRIDQKINRRGVALDLPFASQCLDLARQRGLQLAGEMSAVTNGELTSVTKVEALKTWIEEHGVELPRLKKRNAAGVMTNPTTLNKQATAEILAGDIPSEVRAAIEVRSEAGRLTSLAKLKRVAPMIGHDGRLRGAFRYQGAHTGRWSSSGFQLHNLPKPDMGEATHHSVIETIQAMDLTSLELCFGPPLGTLSRALRSVVVAGPDMDLLAADFAGIEARVLAWLAGQEDALDVFRRGEDIYVHAARNVGSDSRPLGKVLTLALGYGMGSVKLADTAAQRGVVLTLKEADGFKKGWREANSDIVAFWYALEDAFRTATLNPREVVHVGRISMVNNGTYLKVTLPSGRPIFYHRPHIRRAKKTIQIVNDEGEIESKEMESDELRFWTVGKDKKSMRVESTYSGKLAENCTQAVARDLLAEAMHRLDRAHYRIVVHVHDSVAVEVPQGTGSLEEFEAITAQIPTWAAGLPMAVEGYRSKRFRG